MENLDSALDDDDLGSQVSVGSAIFCKKWGVEAQMVRQSTSCSLKRNVTCKVDLHSGSLIQTSADGIVSCLSEVENIW
jgi:hypothetical protein